MSCGHPAEAFVHQSSGPGDPIVYCAWCKDVRDAEAKAARVVRLFAEVAHETPGVAWGYDASGIHMYEPNEPNGCPICEALDAVLVSVKSITGDKLSEQEREALARFRDTGLMWLVNTSLLHPRGFALALELTGDGIPLGLSVVGDGSEPWAYDDETVRDSFANHYNAEQDREHDWVPRLRGEQ